MVHLTHLAYGIGALLVPANCAPFSLTELFPGRLTGSSFGVPGQPAVYDYIVVGGGTAGLTVAARLAENASVAVIEAGGFYELSSGNMSQIPLLDIFWAGKDKNDTNPLVDWGFQTTPQVVCVDDAVHYLLTHLIIARVL